jgi:hypothetical protein
MPGNTAAPYSKATAFAGKSRFEPALPQVISNTSTAEKRVN